MSIGLIGVALLEIGEAVTSLGHLVTAGGGHEDTTIKRQGVTVMLRRAAWRLENGTLEGWADDEVARKTKPVAEKERHATEKVHSDARLEKIVETVAEHDARMDAYAAADLEENEICQMCDGRGWLRCAHVWDVCPACQNEKLEPHP